ncbi:MAG: peptidyl-prolyl cis-trans isomerase, partial [Pyrinomonadaceae bacterium]
VKAGEKIQIPDDKLKEEYDKLSPESKLAGVKVQQIVLKIARADLDPQVKAKADDLVTRARGSNGAASEEGFGILAKGNSEDPATASKGGGLSGLVRKNPNKPDDPLQKTLDMKPGEVSEPIKYGNTYYIFRRGESVPKLFEEAKKELLVSLRNRQSYTSAAQLAARITESLKKEKDAHSVAAKFASEANMTPTEMVRETPFIKPGDDVPEIGSSPQFEEAIAPLKSPNDVGERVGVRGGFAIPMLVDYKDPGYLPAFAEVKAKMEQRVKDERAKSQLEKTARDLASASASLDALKPEATKYGFEAQTSNNYHVDSPLGENLNSSALSEAVYKLKTGEITREPIKINDAIYVIVGADKRTDADMAKYAEQRNDLIERAHSTRRDQIFDDYINGVVQRMRRDSKIKIYTDVLARLSSENDAGS